MSTPKHAPRAGANRRKFEPPRQDTIDRTVWIRPTRLVPPITMPATSYREITDEEVGLKPHEGVQARAEDFVRIMLAEWLRNRRRTA